MDWTVAGYLALILAAVRPLWWLVMHIVGDVKEAISYRAYRRAEKRHYRPKLSVVVHIASIDASSLKSRLDAIYASQYKPHGVIVLAPSNNMRNKALYYRRKHGFSNMRIAKFTKPQVDRNDLQTLYGKYAKGSAVGVFIGSKAGLRPGVLAQGVSWFRNKKLQALTTGTTVLPDNSFLRAFLCIRQLASLHASRARKAAFNMSAETIIFFRQSALKDKKPIRAVNSAAIYAHSEDTAPLQKLIAQKASLPAAIWVLVELLSVSTAIYVYGVERGILLLSFPVLLSLLLTAAVIWRHKTLPHLDRATLLLLAPFAYGVSIVNSVYSLVRYR